jgi:hypothetical protein
MTKKRRMKRILKKEHHVFPDVFSLGFYDIYGGSDVINRHIDEDNFKIEQQHHRTK